MRILLLSLLALLPHLVYSQCPIINANINPCGIDGRNEFVILTNTTASYLTQCDVVLGSLQPDDATVDVDAFGNDGGIAGMYDYNYSWNCTGLNPANSTDACGSGTSCFAWIPEGAAQTTNVCNLLNTFCGGSTVFTPITPAGVPPGGTFICFMGAGYTDATFPDGLDTYAANFGWVTSFCSSGPIYVILGNGNGTATTSGYYGNNASATAPTRGVYISLAGNEYMGIYDPGEISGVTGQGVIACSPSFNLVGTTTYGPFGTYAETANLPCLPPVCEINTANIENVVCNDNGTPTDLTDDTFTFTLNPAGTNLGAQYNVNVGGVDLGTYTYGSVSTPITLSADGSVSLYSIVLTDQPGASCAASFELAAPICGIVTPTCNVTLGTVSISDCNEVAGVSYVTIALNIYWDNAPAGENLNLSISGAPVIAPINTSIVSSPLVFTSVPLLANGSDITISANFETTTTCGASTTFTLPDGCPPEDICFFGLTPFPTPCDVAGNYNLTLNPTWTNSYSSDFWIQINGNNYGPYPFSSPAPVINIDNLPGDGANTTVYMLDTTASALNIAIMAYNPLTDYNLNFSSDQCDEFIYIENNGSTPFDISGYQLYDQSALTAMLPVHIFPAGTVLPANSGIVVFTGATPAFGIPFPLPVTFQSMSSSPPCSGVWDNSGDFAYLAEPSANIIDFATFTVDPAGIDTIGADTVVCVGTTTYFAPNCSGCFGSISGSIYNDINGDGTQTTGELITTTSITLVITDVDGNVLQTQILPGGSYLIEGLPCQELIFTYTLSTPSTTHAISTTNPQSFNFAAGTAVAFNIGVAIIDSIINNPPDPTTPISLYYFEASKEQDKTVLDWVTASEHNVAHFEIWRSSDKNPKAVFVGKTQAAGESTTFKQYQNIDYKPDEGWNYYVLKNVDYDNQYSFSQVRAVWFDAPHQNINIYPNPANNILFVSNHDWQETKLTIYNSFGQAIQETWATNQIEAIDISALAQGMYYIKIVSSKNETSLSFIVNE